MEKETGTLVAEWAKKKIPGSAEDASFIIRLIRGQGKM